MTLKSQNVFTISLLVVIILGLSLPFWKQTQKVLSKESSCICSYDGFGYYMYLPSLLQNGSLKMTPEWAQHQQDNYCNGNLSYQLSQRENGNYINVYHLGLSLVQSPAFLIGHFFAKFFDYPQDGMSMPYHIAYIINAWLFSLLGIYFFYRLMREFFTPLQSTLLLFMMVFGTNYWFTTTNSFDLQHHYLFAIIAAFLFYFFRYLKTSKGKWIPPTLLGLIVLIRPTHLVLGIIPALLFYKEDKKTWFKQLLPYLICGFLWQLPQILYWKLIGDSWFLPNLHLEEVILKDPHFIDFLFSFRKGWLIYSPIFLLMPIGLFYFRKIHLGLFRIIIITLIIEVWIMASWECWWYASSFGQRPMIDIYPLMAIPFGYLFIHIAQLWKQITVGIVISGCIVLNLFQSEQMKNGLLSSDRMTKDHYFYIFGKSQLTNYTDVRLLIDRNDITWTQRKGDFQKIGYQLDTNVLFRSHIHYFTPGSSKRSVIKYPLFQTLSTDEAQIIVSLSWKGEEKSLNTLKCETGNKHNMYSWKLFQLPTTHMIWKDTVFVFNLDDQHHSYDFLDVYFDNSSAGSSWVKNIQINSISLIRNPKK